MMDIEELKKRLRQATKTGKPDGYTILAVSEWADAANAIESLQRDNEKLKSAIDRQAQTAISGMNAAKLHAQLMLAQAEKLNAESSPELIASERAANEALTRDVERLQRELEESRQATRNLSSLLNRALEQLEEARKPQSTDKAGE